MPELPVLSPEEQRVLGSLLEKEVTVPGSYPMTLTAVRTASNQSSSRDPVVDYDERVVTETLRSLKDRELAVVTWDDRGRRTMKWAQRLVPVLGLADDERALLTVLLLRGPQAPGALRTRTERLHPFADRQQVETVLHRMAAREQPLVTELPRRAREQDRRWVHLLGPVDTGDGARPAAPDVDREQVLRDGPDARDERVRGSYAAIAAPYADEFTGELPEGLPFEAWLLDRVASHAAGGPVVEAGCGPGHVTAYLAAAGADATGVDLTPAMVDEARRRFPGGRYEVGDLRRLMRPADAEGWAAVLAWYSAIHLAPSELPDAVAALARPLAPGGWLVLALHTGTGLRTSATWFDREIDLELVLHERDDVLAAVAAAGLVDVEWYHRGPFVARGETSERLYVVARRP